jgi:hypothetical protein
MANETPGGQDPKFERRVVRWLLDLDPSIRWQVMRDLAEDPDEPVAAERMTGVCVRESWPGSRPSAEVSTPRIYLLADASSLGTAIPSSTDLRKGERRWTTGKGEHGARTGRIAGHPQQGDDPGLPAHWALRYGKATTDMKHVT